MNWPLTTLTERLTALENAISAASLLLLTEAVLTELPEKKAESKGELPME